MPPNSTAGEQDSDHILGNCAKGGPDFDGAANLPGFRRRGLPDSGGEGVTAGAKESEVRSDWGQRRGEAKLVESQVSRSAFPLCSVKCRLRWLWRARVAVALRPILQRPRGDPAR
jgi:hypothetical protein